MLNLNQLRVFHAVAQTRSFTRAAGAVHLTQPGISKHVKQLEEYYGVPLFDRLGKTVALTEAGKILFETTQEIVGAITAAEERIRELQGGSARGKLALGASFTVGIYVMPNLLSSFRRQYPAIETTLDIMLSKEIVAKVLDNSFDVGVVGHEVRHDKLIARDFMTDELVAIISVTHKWASKKRIRPQELIGEPFIASAKGSGTRAVVEGRLRQHGITLNKVMDFGNTEGVKKAVEAGLGVSILSKSVVQRELSAGLLRVLFLAGMNMKREYSYVYRKDKYLSNAAKAFLDLLQRKAG
jgi:DNA-binding transcriptional LysR family regulator